MRLLIGIGVLLIIPCAGCGQRANQLATEPQRTVDVIDVTVRLKDLEPSGLTLTPKTLVPVKGRFRLTDSKQVPAPIVVQFVGIRNGNRVIHESFMMMPIKTGEVVTFEGELMTPRSAGTFGFEVLEGSQEIMKGEVVITDNEFSSE